MNQESIFEDIIAEPKEVKTIFRFVGIARLLMVILLILTSVALLISSGTVFYYALIARKFSEFNWQNASFTIIPVILYVAMLMYYIPQTKFELTLSHKLYEKRKFRLFTIVINILFIVALLFSYTVNRWHISGTSIPGFFMYGLLILFLFIIVMDIKLLASQKDTKA